MLFLRSKYPHIARYRHLGHRRGPCRRPQKGLNRLDEEDAEGATLPRAVRHPGARVSDGAIGWRHKSEHYTSTRWCRRGFLIVFPDGIEEIDPDGNRIRLSAL